MNRHPVQRIKKSLTSFVTMLFGTVKWQTPAWVQFLKNRLIHSPKKSMAVLVGLIMVLSIASYGYYWYQHLPKPVLIESKINLPNISTINAESETLIIQPLTIDFGIEDNGFQPKSVAPIGNIGKVITEGIKMQPEIPGEWRWASDNQLVFNPSQDWPAGQEYRITFDSTFFAKQAKMAHLSASFTTHPLTVNINQLRFYQDPVHPEEKKVVATMDFNYPIDPVSLKEHILFKLQQLKNDKLDLKAKDYPFHLTFDKFKRTAYLQSDNLTLPKVPRYLRLTVSKGLKAQSGPGTTSHEESQSVLIPDASNFFQVKQVESRIIPNQNDRPEQILSIETSIGISGENLKKSLQVYLLPKDYPANKNEAEKPNHAWLSPGEVTPAILALSQPLMLEDIPADKHYATQHFFRYKASPHRYLYIKINKGAKAFAGYLLSQNAQATVEVPEYPKQITFLHKGSLLALASEKKLSVMVRGLESVRFSIARVLPDNVNQLVSQTQGDFNNPLFINQDFTEANISEIDREIQNLPGSDLSELKYTSIDVSKYLGNAQNNLGPNGLFLLKAQGWDKANQSVMDVSASRLLLVTDLGMMVKDNSDSSHDVYVQSISTGKPVAQAKVSVLGKNGLPILSGLTDDNGRVSFPSLVDFVDDKQPVAYLANAQGDVSFIPFAQFSRQLNYTRFDVDGAYQYGNSINKINAYVFSDRGMYRPGDQVHLAMIVKNTFAQDQKAGLPLIAKMTDPRGATIIEKALTLDESGLLAFDYTTTATSPTGNYYVYVYLVQENKAENIIGSTQFSVSEFLPDTMRIDAQFLSKPQPGWLSPNDLKAQVSLTNLFGAPAIKRTVQAHVMLKPHDIQFTQFPDYVFADPLRLHQKKAKTYSDELKSGLTNEDGQVVFNLDLQRFEQATFELTFFAEGFAAEGGRSVTTQIKTLVSPLAYVLGYKPSQDLQYIKQNTQADIHLIAVNHQLSKQDLDGLTAELLKVDTVSTLVKNPDGTYQYKSIEKDKKLSSKELSFGKDGLNYPLPSETIGNFKVRFLNQDKQVLTEVPFSVVGSSQVSLPKNAELAVKLNKEKYDPGETIELQITAPYTGSGLITIERDKVYASQWFTTNTTSSLQTITLPKELLGNAYVNVAFVRAWDSPEIFISPLSYQVQAFDISIGDHEVGIDLTVPDLARPGEDMAITYKTDLAGKIIVYAVDEGILQVANYRSPDPLSFFFQKLALEVTTQQTLDLILPDFVQDRELSAVGGDADAEALLSAHLNPFKRKTDLPVVYWSGIVDADDQERQLTFKIPDYFNGRLRVMAVAVSDNAVGAADKETKVHGYFVISPNAPTFVAPDDQFTLSATIANQLHNSGSQPEITVGLDASPEFQIVQYEELRQVIKENGEDSVQFNVKAGSEPGAGTLTVRTSYGNKSSQMLTGVSIRPASNYETNIQSGMVNDPQKSLTVSQDYYQAYHQNKFMLSTSPVILLSGLSQYLDNYPFGCSEQLVSKAFPWLAIQTIPGLSNNPAETQKKIEQTIDMLTARQNANGSFKYWPSDNQTDANQFISLYAMHFLLTAREHHYPLTNDMYFAGISYLKELANRTPGSPEEAREIAYAIYLLTRNEIVTTAYLTNLILNLEKHPDWPWQKEITGSFVAASFQLLKNEKEAQKLIIQYEPGQATNYNEFLTGPVADTLSMYLLANHFPHLADKARDKGLLHLIDNLNSADINTLLSGYGSLVLAAYGDEASNDPQSSLSVDLIRADKTKKSVTLDSQNPILTLTNEVTKIIIQNPQKQPLYYQLTEEGFRNKPVTKPLQSGIEIYRDYRNSENQSVTTAKLGEELTVHIQIRAVGYPWLSNVAVIDLLPGGFDVVRNSVPHDPFDYVDIREDRVNFFMGLSDTVTEIEYKIKAVNAGQFAVPASFAQAMYAPAIQGHSVQGQININEEYQQ